MFDVHKMCRKNAKRHHCTKRYKCMWIYDIHKSSQRISYSYIRSFVINKCLIDSILWTIPILKKNINQLNCQTYSIVLHKELKSIFDPFHLKKSCLKNIDNCSNVNLHRTVIGSCTDLHLRSPFVKLSENKEWADT
jgi:hypothetical protein